MSKQSVEQERTPLGEKINAIISLGSYPLGVVVGALTMDVHIRDSLYKNFISRGFFTDGGKIFVEKPIGGKDQVTQRLQQEVYDTLIKRHAEKKELGKVSQNFIYRYESAHKKPLTFSEPANLITEENLGVVKGRVAEKFDGLVNKIQRNEIKQFFQDIELGRRDYWRSITRNQKVEVLITGFTFAAVAIGAMLAVSDHRTALEKLTSGTKKTPLPAPEAKTEATGQSVTHEGGREVRSHRQRLQQEETAPQQTR